MSTTTRCTCADRDDDGPFAASRAEFENLINLLADPQTGTLTHADLEQTITTRGRDVLLLLLQNHLDLRTKEEDRVTVTAADGTPQPRTEPGHTRKLATVFGVTTVERIAYRAPGQSNLHPADATLNLPKGLHSHGLRNLAAIEATRGSYDDAADAIERATGQRLGKRQVEDLTAAAAVDFDAFYRHRTAPPCPPGHVLALSADGKGVVMRPEGLRPATARAAAKTTHKLSARLSRGEKRGRKRMAEVGAVYEVAPVARTAADILPKPGEQHPATADGPTIDHKWLTASVTE